MAVDSIEKFDWARNMARVAAGFKNGPYFNTPTPVPAMEIGGDWPQEVLTKLQDTKISQPTPTDPWVARYPNSKM